MKKFLKDTSPEERERYCREWLCKKECPLNKKGFCKMLEFKIFNEFLYEEIEVV